MVLRLTHHETRKCLKGCMLCSTAVWRRSPFSELRSLGSRPRGEAGHALQNRHDSVNTYMVASFLLCFGTESALRQALIDVY